MSHFSGLQIDPRCVKCGRPPTVQAPLFEMRNHLYICSHCKQAEEQNGKQIAWKDGLEMTQSMQQNAPSIQMTQLMHHTTPLPKNSLFGVLGVPLTASSLDVESAIGDKMRVWMQASSSDEQMQAIEQLREWQEALVSDPQFLQKQVEKVQPPRSRGSALIIEGKPVYTAQELLQGCEASEKGWLDAEELLRKGELQSWILFHLGNRMVANEADRFVQANIPPFRVLNYTLYRLLPERRFRLYSQEVWQAINSIPEVDTADTLARICDQYWEKGEWHLYKGAMVAWLEFSQGCRGLSEYYATSIKPYAEDPLKRGLGLELILERVVPKLTPPKLTVAFNGIQDESYVLESWDREISPPSITVQINNTTRGFSSMSLEIVNKNQKPSKTEPAWIYLANSRSVAASGINVPLPYSSILPVQNVPVAIAGRKGAGIPADRKITLTNLEKLKRGKRYERTLRISKQREYGNKPVIHEYPIVLKTMSYFQGFRGLLWRFGLRGGIPGLVWNAGIGILLAFTISQVLLNQVYFPYNHWYSEVNYPFDAGSVLRICLLEFFNFLQQIPYISFILITGIIMGIAGFLTGIGKGHTSYRERNSHGSFVKSTFWLSMLFFPILFFLTNGYIFLQTALAYSSNDNTLAALCDASGSLLICCLIFLIACVIARIRTWTEKILRRQYKDLLLPKAGE
jgi:hypothetical protein